MKAAVFFPGIGYHCDKPLLYYSRKLAQECGYEETIALSYTYDGGNIRGNEENIPGMKGKGDRKNKKSR